MNNKLLKQLKIDERYVLSPNKFLGAYSLLIGNISSCEKLNIHDMHHIIENKLEHASIHLVTLDNILRGEIILIGKPNNFKAYHRPIIEKPKISKINNVSTKIDEDDLSNYGLIRLYQLLKNESDNQKLVLYLNEIYDRAYEDIDELESTHEKIRCKKRS